MQRTQTAMLSMTTLTANAGGWSGIEVVCVFVPDFMLVLYSYFVMSVHAAIQVSNVSNV